MTQETINKVLTKYGIENLIVIEAKKQNATKNKNGILVNKRFNSILKFST